MQRILRVDLTSSTYRIEELPENLEEEYVGGRGLGIRLLFENCPRGLDPLDPANPLIFSAGPAQGVGALYSPKTVLTTKSPLTGVYLRCVSGGSLGIALRKSGLYSLIITGKAPRPTYIVLRNQEVEFRSAEHLWGASVADSQNGMLTEAGISGAAVLGIGPAGEKGVKLACVLAEAERYRAFGRGGAGALMGSKNLKGLVAHGNKRLAPARPEAFAEVKESIRAFIKNNPQWTQRWKVHGTGADVVHLSKIGLLPTRNWQTGSFERAEAIDVGLSQFFQENPRKVIACGPNCPNPCSHYATITSGEYAGAKARGPEYETIYSFGSNCGVDRMDAIIAAGQICDEHGLDTMSTGVAVAFAMECFERGLIGKKDTDGLELRFGNYEAMLAMVANIAERKGLGALLGEGVRKASQEIPGSEGIAMHTKGLELGGYEARASNGQALSFALCPIGGSHGVMGLPARVESLDGSGGKMEGKGQLVRNLTIDKVLFDSAVVCQFGAGPLRRAVIGQLLRAITGRDWSDADLERLGMRVAALERMFNVREGLTRDEDTLPRRLLEQAMPTGPTAGRTVNIEPLKDDGYAALGWDQSGIPTEQLLAGLNLKSLTQEYA
ncbi:MAG: aldehyde ferredoxin oxidoreductase family protein [Chloroflexi bacterium]|nr:aldehyde ferredoxin oxidoreductase family protein [Chloroflexota bacterium]